MTADQPPLWGDGWEAEADAHAGTYRRRGPRIPTAHGRPSSRPQKPDHRPVHDVPTGDLL